MHRLRVVAVVVVVITTVVAGWSTTSGAATPSLGCDFLNSGAADGTYGSTGLAVKDYAAGEVITVSATIAVGQATPSSIYLTKRVAENSVFIEDPVEVDTDGFPGTVTYTIPTDASYRLSWGGVGGGAEWQATCEPASAPPPSSSTTTTSTEPPPPDVEATTSTTTTVDTAPAVDSGTATAPVATAANVTPTFTG